MRGGSQAKERRKVPVKDHRRRRRRLWRRRKLGRGGVGGGRRNPPHPGASAEKADPPQWGLVVGGVMAPVGDRESVAP